MGNPPRVPRPGMATFRVDTGVRWLDLCGRLRAGPKAGQEPSPRAKIGGSTGGGPTVPKRQVRAPKVSKLHPRDAGPCDAETPKEPSREGTPTGGRKPTREVLSGGSASEFLRHPA